MKKWTEGYVRDSAIVDWKQFRTATSSHISTLNGGMDRSTMPRQFLDENQKVDGAFHRAYFIDRGNMTANEDSGSGSGTNFRGLTYNTYGGGWVAVDEFQVEDFKDGMLHWEFCFHFHNNTYYADNPKSITIRLLVDGVEVNTMYKISEPIGTFRMSCDVPISGGNHALVVQARSVSPSDAENSLNLFNFFSMRHLVIGRWR